MRTYRDKGADEMKKQHVILSHDKDEVIQLRSGVDFRENPNKKFVNWMEEAFKRAEQAHESASNPV